MLSACTLLEVAIKASLGKLEIGDEWAEELLSEGFELLPISPIHATAYRRLPYIEVSGAPHRDPFDRMLVAQARAERVPIVTRDAAVAAHGVQIIW